MSQTSTQETGEATAEEPEEVFAAPVEVLERHVAAYNDHDLEAIGALYIEDIVVMDGEEERVRGRADLLKLVFQSQFENNGRVKVHTRTVEGEWVVDYQTMYGTARGDVALVVGYRVRRGLIDLAVYMA